MNNGQRELPLTYLCETTETALLISCDLGELTFALALPLPKPIASEHRSRHCGSCRIIRGVNAPHTIRYFHVRQTDAVRAYMRLKAVLERSMGNGH